MAVAMTTLEPAGVGMEGVSTCDNIGASGRGHGWCQHTEWRGGGTPQIQIARRGPRGAKSTKPPRKAVVAGSFPLAPGACPPPPPAPLDGGVRNLGSGAIYSLSL